MPDYIVHKAIELDAVKGKGREALEACTHWIISPKYDGCHVVFAFDNGKCVGTYSRTGESVLSMPHIAAALPELYPLGDGRTAVCGEAWMLDTPFNEISGTFRRQYPQPTLGFVPFDVVPFDYNDEQTSGPPILLGQFNNRPYTAPYRVRIESLVQQRANVPPSLVFRPRYTELVGVSLADAWPVAEEQAKWLKTKSDNHYDGSVLARADGAYAVGSGKGGEFVKCKPLISVTVTANALFPAHGEKTGKNTLAIGFELGGKAQKVSTGLTQKQIDDFIADNGLILGHRIEVEAMGITSGGFLREPRFKGFRHDA